MFWLAHFRGDERTFWKTMNPARCGALYQAYVGTFYRPSLPSSGGGYGDIRAYSRRGDTPRNGVSLAEYLAGGGI